MDEQRIALDDDERPALQPMQELVAVGGRENRRDRVAAMRFRMPGSDGEKMEIVVSEDGDCRIAERLHLAQHGERFGSAVDEVADEPEPVAAARREADQLEQLAELRVAALDVADRVVAHWCTMTRLASGC